MLEWVIIGGGIQGCTMAAYLLKQNITTKDNVAIIDTHKKPLERWSECTQEIEMQYLRSPSIHHLDPSPFALEKFSKSCDSDSGKSFLGPYDRPSLSLFNRHSHHVLSEIDIEDCWLQARVESLVSKDTYWRITTDTQTVIDSKRVVIAIGIGEQPVLPEWAVLLKEKGAQVSHVFGNETKQIDNQTRFIIVGGGITAAHAAIKWSNLAPGRVSLLTRHPFRVHPFDSSPGWLGPKMMKAFNKVESYKERRNIIRQARYRGSMPAELKTNITKAKKEGKLEIVIDEIEHVSVKSNKTTLHLKNTELEAENIILATGFKQSAPGMEWLQDTITAEKLRCADCGYPIVERSLEWKKDLFVLGALAELEIGPVSRNISGARRGAKRIIHYA